MLLRSREINYKRESGILLHISSLPSNFGIGSFGREAYNFVDFLKTSHQTYWQLCPLCPISGDNSPYDSLSAFAGEILYIDIEMLLNDGLIDSEDISEIAFPENVDYKKVRSFKLPLLKKAAKKFDLKNKEYIRFQKSNEYWLSDYAVFMAIKEYYQYDSILSFEDGLKYRLPISIEHFKRKNAEKILFYKITQYLFFSQYQRLKKYAAKNGIRIIGDIPLYVSLESADVWSNPDVFRLGRDMTPVLIAGLQSESSPDIRKFSCSPAYDWDFQKKTNYFWWRQRLTHNLKMYDIVKINNFNDFADCYTIPFGTNSIKSGSWEKGPGISFWDYIKTCMGNIPAIADDVKQSTSLISSAGFPDTRILQYAFNSDIKNLNLPKNYIKNCICYTGTANSDTLFGWYSKASRKEKIIYSRFINTEHSSSPVHSLIEFGMKSKSRIVIIPFQDYLCLDSDARLNDLNSFSGNWEWRFKTSDLSKELADTVARLSRGRN